MSFTTNGTHVSAATAKFPAEFLGKVFGATVATDVNQLSELQQERLYYELQLPKILKVPHALVDGEERCSVVNNSDSVCNLFPHLIGDQGSLSLVHLQPTGTPLAEKGAPLRVGVVLSGGQAAGGHNVIWGLYEYLKHRYPGSTLIGFLGGPKGVMQSKYKEITATELANFRNQGGFHLLGSGRDKIEKPDQLRAAAKVCQDLALNGLIIIGGDDSNTNACVLAEYFLSIGIKTSVIGVPKTMDGDLKCADVPISFGFDTACKVYSEAVGNIMIDAASAKKYWHFVRLMGRSSSHVTLEVALQTHPQWAFISEEVATSKLRLRDVASIVADLVASRAAQGRNYGIILLPEGLIEHVHDFSTMIAELNDLMASGMDPSNLDVVAVALSPGSRELFDSLSVGFQREFLEDRDPHGNVQVSHIETEKLLIRLVEAELHKRKALGTFNGKFAGVPHFMGYEGRCSLPSNFDATYTFGLGAAAGALVGGGRTGLMATVSNLHRPASEWLVGGVPIVSMMHLERRSGKDKPVIRKALVELEGPPMMAYRAMRTVWAQSDAFRAPGPIQFKGHDFADVATITLALELNNGNPILLRSIADE